MSRPSRLTVTRTSSSKPVPRPHPPGLPGDPIEDADSDEDERVIRRDGLVLSHSAFLVRLNFLKQRLASLRSLYPRTLPSAPSHTETRVTFGIEAGEALRFLRTHFGSVAFVEQLLRTQQATGPSGLMAIAVLSGAVGGLECLL